MAPPGLEHALLSLWVALWRGDGGDQPVVLAAWQPAPVSGSSLSCGHCIIHLQPDVSLGAVTFQILMLNKTDYQIIRVVLFSLGKDSQCQTNKQTNIPTKNKWMESPVSSAINMKEF